MAKGKLILICQSGGDFVTNADGTMSYSGGEASAANINHDIPFNELKLEVAETCDLDQKTVSIKYFLPGNKRNLIMVKNDKDVKRMIEFHSGSITADVFVTGTAGFDHDALKVNVNRPTRSKERDPVKHSAPSTPASPPSTKRTRNATGKSAGKPAKLPTRRATAKAATETVSPATRRTTRSTAKAAVDVHSEGPADSDDNSEGSTRETSPSTTSSEEADDAARSDYSSDYVPSRSGRKPNSQVDVNTSPADTVKKRRRTASSRDDDSRDTKSRKRSYLPNADNSEARKSLGKSSRTASERHDSREKKSRRKNSRNQSSFSLVDGSDHSLDSGTRDVDDSYNSFPVVVWDNDARPESLVGITGVGQEFESVHEFRDALQKYSVANRFAYKFTKDETDRASAACVAEGCSWKIHAALVTASQKFTIKLLKKAHTHKKDSRSSAQFNKKWLVSTIKERLQNFPNENPKEMANGIMSDYGVELNYVHVYRALEDAREELHGSTEESYNKLPLFCEKVIETNPGSFSKLIIGDEKRFQSLFVSFYASICGFQKGCRPLLFLESTSLKSKYQEVLLTANAIDGNDGFFPVAFAVVDVENDDRWHWFLEQLKSVISDLKPITFVSDRDKNLNKSVLSIFENAHHGFSMYHLLENLKRNARFEKGPFHGDGRGFLPIHFLAAAHAVRLNGFKKSMEQIKLISSQSYNWVMQIEAKYWATNSFKGERYNYITQDVGEPYSKLMEEHQESPILHKIDALINMLIESVDDARLDASVWTTKLTPLKEKFLQEETLKVQGLKVLISSDTLFEVREDLTHVVNTSNWSCSCLGWKETGLPCRHALAVFNSTGKNPYDYCSLYFSLDFYRSTYFESIYPVPIYGNPMEIENVVSNVNENTVVENVEGAEKPLEKVEGAEKLVEKDGEAVVDENPVEWGDLIVDERPLEKEGDLMEDGKQAEKEGERDSAIDGKTVEKATEESTIDGGPPVEKEGEGDPPVEKEGDEENEGDPKGKEDDSSESLMADKKDTDEKKEADDSNVFVRPPIPSKAPPVEEKGKPEWNETEEEGKRTVTCTKCKQAGHNKKSCKADVVSV